MAGVPAGGCGAVRLLRARLAGRRPNLAASPPGRSARHRRDHRARGPRHRVPAAAAGAGGVHPPPRATSVARRLGARAPGSAVGAGRRRGPHRGEHRRARAHLAGARLGHAGPAPVWADVLRRPRAAPRAARGAAAVRRRRPRGRLLERLRRRLRPTPGDGAVAVAILHGHPLDRARRLRAGALHRLSGGGRGVQDRLGQTQGGTMTDPRITPLTPDQAAPEVRPIFDTYLRERGNVPNMFRTVALRPAHLRTMIAHFRTVMNEGTVPPLLKELLWVRISHLNRCRY